MKLTSVFRVFTRTMCMSLGTMFYSKCHPRDSISFSMRYYFKVCIYILCYTLHIDTTVKKITGICSSMRGVKPGGRGGGVLPKMLYGGAPLQKCCTGVLHCQTECRGLSGRIIFVKCWVCQGVLNQNL